MRDADCQTLSASHAAAAPKLRRFISGYTDYWERTGALTRREVPSLACVLIVNLGAPIRITSGDGRLLCLGEGEGFVTGLHDRHALSHSDGSQAGVHVWLTQNGFEQLLGSAAGAMVNQGVRLPDIFGPSGAALGERLLDARDFASRLTVLDDVLGRWLEGGEVERPDTTWAFSQLRRDPSRAVADLARDIGCSRKTFSARFRTRYGIAPKTAARLARFERVTAACSAGTPDWAALAHDAGYFDQSHMIRDFTAFAGLSPAQYAARLTAETGVIEPAV